MFIHALSMLKSHTHTTEKFIGAQAVFGATTIIILLIRDVHIYYTWRTFFCWYRDFFNWSMFPIFYRVKLTYLWLTVSGLQNPRSSNSEYILSRGSFRFHFLLRTEKTSHRESKTQNDTKNESWLEWFQKTHIYCMNAALSENKINIIIYIIVKCNKSNSTHMHDLCVCVSYLLMCSFA